MPAHVAPTLTDRRKALLRLLGGGALLSVREIANATGLSPSTVHQHLERLAQGGAATSVPGRWRSWRSTEHLQVESATSAATRA